MTTELIPVEPLGLGTAEVESLASYICRLAKCHSTSIPILTKHLTRWALNRGFEFDRVPRPITVCRPYFCTVDRIGRGYSEILSLATGFAEVARTSFLPLAPAISLGVDLQRKWCPACYLEDQDNDNNIYDRLSWCLPQIERCSIHRLRLEVRCPNCSTRQDRYQVSGDIGLCYRCASSLIPTPASWEFRSEVSRFEPECLMIVESISKGDLNDVADDAFGIFRKELGFYLSRAGVSKLRFDHKLGWLRPVGQNNKPRLGKFLDICQKTFLNPAYVLQDPVMAAKDAVIDVLSRARMRYAVRFVNFV